MVQNSELDCDMETCYIFSLTTFLFLIDFFPLLGSYHRG